MSWFSRPSNQKRLLETMVNDENAGYQAFNELQKLVARRDTELLEPLVAALSAPPRKQILSKEPNFEVASWAASLLGSIGGARARDALVNRLTTGTWSDQFAIAAASALANIGDSEAAGSLAEVLAKNQNDLSRTSLVDALAKLNNPVAVVVLKECLTNQRIITYAEELRSFHRAARSALRSIGASTATAEDDLVSDLAEALDLSAAGKGEVYEPADTAAKMGDLALPELRKRIASGESRQIRAAAEAILKLAPDLGLPLVVDILKSPDVQSRLAAAQYLSRQNTEASRKLANLHLGTETDEGICRHLQHFLRT